MSDAPTSPADTSPVGTAPAVEIALDMARRARWVAPVILALSAGWGWHGVFSSAYGLVLVVVNFLIAAWLLAIGAKVSPAAMAGSAMFGYILRLGLIWAAVAAVKNSSWVSLVPLGITIIVTHLALLIWEVRHVSGSYAYPGLKPTSRHARRSTPDSPTADRPASAA
jgi:hypothetical protein